MWLNVCLTLLLLNDTMEKVVHNLHFVQSDFKKFSSHQSQFTFLDRSDEDLPQAGTLLSTGGGGEASPAVLTREGAVPVSILEIRKTKPKAIR